MGSKLSLAMRPQLKDEAAPRLPEVFAFDDIDIATSTTTPNGLMDLQYSNTDRTIADTTTPPPEVPAAEPKEKCVTCVCPLPDEKDPKHAKEAIKPCRECESTYCGSCIRIMFMAACQDTTRMPPRCCMQLQIHHAKPFLTKEEITTFKAKYEEWMTPNPFYCPIPTCSAFIPDRLHPGQKIKGKRVDSGVGTPSSKPFACPTCSTDICPDCRQATHPDSLCNISDFGIDVETTDLLKSWGYKKCPKCGHGLKRMYGCNHMECLCGAHFCYSCLGNPDNCSGGCVEDEDDYYSDDEPDQETDEEDDEADYGVLPPDTVEAAAEEAAGQEAGLTAGQVAATDAPNAAMAPQPIARPRNLDGGGQRYWETQDLFFGAEPEFEDMDRAWNCEHDFETYKITLREALIEHGSHADMECVKCWCTVHPEIEAPSHIQEKMVPGGTGRGGRGRARFVPPCRLFRADAGTAPHPTTTISSPRSQSVPARESSPMKDIRYSDRVVDTYGNIIATSEFDFQRRASHVGTDNALVADQTAQQNPAYASGVNTTTSSLAHECQSCHLIFCASCKERSSAALEQTEA
jgi:hypothetical protein